MRRAIDTSKKILENANGKKVYILHEIVHNSSVVEQLKKMGAITVDTLSEIPHGACVIFSAHGVADSVENEAAQRGLETIDATCPLVKSVQNRAAALSKAGYTVILFGRAGHRETEGITGRIKGQKILIETLEDAQNFTPEKDTLYTCLSQTTMNKAELELLLAILKKKIPSIKVNANVCPATDERQSAVKKLALKCEIVFVAGSQNSSNTRRLCETAESAVAKAVLVDSPDILDSINLDGIQNAGVAAGASAPEESVQKIIEKLKSLGGAFKGDI